MISAMQVPKKEREESERVRKRKSSVYMYKEPPCLLVGDNGQR